MDYFDQKKNVEEYIRMVKDFDGRDLITILKNQLPAGSTVLELGMGPGKDLDILSQDYKVTGSDNSSVFLEKYRKNNPSADLLKLDAVTLETVRKFDCIYSNKVLHHLTKADLHQSFIQQKKRLTKCGLLMHSFWLGDKEEEYDGLRFVYYLENEIISMAGPEVEVLKIDRYKEIDPEDSFYVLLQLSK